MPWVNAYERGDGTKVRGYSRWAPGARSEMAKVAVIALVILGFGGAGTTAATRGSGSGELPTPKSTVVYPIEFPGPDAGSVPRPTPTVSYPIPWDRG
ncbi:hypothetical protein AQJ23_45090 [Streptomyces antibioticus]|nr:hypothetical protein AQJ23_45090 [Streptomyces antibioticus]